MDIKITLTADQALLDALNRIAGAFGKPAAPSQNGNGVVKPVKKEEPKIEGPAEVKVQHIGNEFAAEKTEDERRMEVRAAVAEKTTAGKTDEVKALLKKYGAKKVPELKAEDFENFLNELKEV